MAETSENVRIVCADSEDCLDALICALVASAHELEQVLTATDREAAQVEGWIQLPRRGPLGALGPH